MNNFYWNENRKYVLGVLREVIEDNGLPIFLTDVTYLNDTSPSFEIESETQKFILFLPNSWRNNGEETNEYLLIYDEDYAYGLLDNKSFKTLEEFINHLLVSDFLNQHDLIKQD
jgi:hypothetical protein